MRQPFLYDIHDDFEHFLEFGFHGLGHESLFPHTRITGGGAQNKAAAQGRTPFGKSSA
jgi:hypothetical protein